jgi:hypothetical protein
MVSVGDNEIYTDSGLKGVTPYVQCVDVVFLARCARSRGYKLVGRGSSFPGLRRWYSVL